MDIDARAFGQLEGQVQALTLMMAAQKQSMDAQNEVLARLTAKIDQLSAAMAEARGGGKTMLWLAGLSASVAGFISWSIQHLKP